ncbi:MAG: CcmD family protein [Ferruginibacter sp.]
MISISMMLFFTLPCLAQDNPEMADTMRSNGKIYVVVGCALIILCGLFLYAWRIDRKVTRAEKNLLP